METISNFDQNDTQGWRHFSKNRVLQDYLTNYHRDAGSYDSWAVARADRTYKIY